MIRRRTICASVCGFLVLSGAAVATDADGLRDSVRDGETGLLFPYGDHRLLARRLVRILTDDSFRRRLSENAVAWAKTFTWERAAEETMETVDEVMGNFPRRGAP